MQTLGKCYLLYFLDLSFIKKCIYFLHCIFFLATMKMASKECKDGKYKIYPSGTHWVAWFHIDLNVG